MPEQFCWLPAHRTAKILAEDFGELYVYYNDRVTSVRTLAREFTMKLTGRQSYRGLTPQQVLSGWMFYYDSWKREPMIEVKGRGRLPLTDLNPEEEQFQVVSMAATWSIIRIFPYVGEDGTMMWYASTDTRMAFCPQGVGTGAGRCGSRGL